MSEGRGLHKESGAQKRVSLLSPELQCTNFHVHFTLALKAFKGFNRIRFDQ